MASGTSFKQQCPSCETLVPIKDARLVGKKIECPKCKDKFIVKSPEKKKAGDDDEEEDPKSKSGPGKKGLQSVGDIEKGKKATAKAKPAKAEDDDDEELEDEDDKGKKSKKKAGMSRFTMGVALAVVGVVVLAAAAFLILRGRGASTNQPIAKSSPRTGNVAAVPPPTPTETTTPPADNQETSKDTSPRLVPVDTPLTAASAELTNLLPNDTDYVAHVPFRVLFDRQSPLASALFEQAGGLDDNLLRKKLGFSVQNIDDLIRGDHYGPSPWSFTVLHFKEIVDQDAVKKTLALKPAPSIPGKSYAYFLVGDSNPWFEQLARFALGVPRALRAVALKERRPLFLHFHNPQTMIFADEAPMVALLKHDKHFNAIGEPKDLAKDASAEKAKEAAPPPPQEPAPRPKEPGKKGKGKGKGKEKEPAPAAPDKPATDTPAEAVPQTPALYMETYMTIKPNLKAMLDRMESVAADREKIWFSSATDLDAARLPAGVFELRAKALWYPRLVWDVGLLLQERNPRARVLGVAFVMKDGGHYQMRNELECPLENDARTLQTELATEIAPMVALFIERLLAHKVDVPKTEQTLPPEPSPLKRPVSPVKPPDPTGKDKIEEPPPGSRISVLQKDKNVEFILDLKPEPGDRKLQGIASLIICGLRGELDVAAGISFRQQLANAGSLLPEKGIAEPNVSVPTGEYPPGAFHRKSLAGRFAREPLQRVSWMAALLPYLGENLLFGKINFNDSWRGPSNWVSAATLVPQFLDPAYPPSLRYVSRPDLPLDPAATHFVGIAGVGVDAADYDPLDPAFKNKRGLMSYEKGLALEEVRSGHGLANTILMIQVAPDSLTGVTPWMAGGGSTLRGVPEKNSIAPFVFSVPGKKAARGTYALMADGSVRFIDQNVPDELFKALATATTPLPEGFDLDAPDTKTPIVREPKAYEKKK